MVARLQRRHVDTPHVKHHRELGSRFRLIGIDNALDVVVVAEVPRAELVARVIFALAQALPDLKEVDRGVTSCAIRRFHQVIFELIVVDQASVSDRAIQYLDLFSKHHGSPAATHRPLVRPCYGHLLSGLGEVLKSARWSYTNSG